MRASTPPRYNMPILIPNILESSAVRLFYFNVNVNTNFNLSKLVSFLFLLTYIFINSLKKSNLLISKTVLNLYTII